MDYKFAMLLKDAQILIVYIVSLLQNSRDVGGIFVFFSTLILIKSSHVCNNKFKTVD